MSHHRLCLAWVALLLAACSDEELQLPNELSKPIEDNKLKVSGAMCAQNTEDAQAFLKILFVIDQSNSMNVSDPNSRRVTAAVESMERFVIDPLSLTLRDGVAFGVIGFFGSVVTYTRSARGLPGFSTDGANIIAGLSRLAVTSSNTGYDKALSQAFVMLDTDMARLPDLARGTSRYEVVFLSDGMPFPDNCRNEDNSPSAALDHVERIKSLSLIHNVDVRLHTVFAATEDMFTPGNDVDGCPASDFYEAEFNQSIGQETRAILQAMANAGGGSFSQFLNGDAITFTDFEFAEAQRLFALSSFAASNVHARPAGLLPLADSDADGLADADEFWIGTESSLADSDGDGLSDGVEWRLRRSGFDPLDPTDGRCADEDRVDSDGDGLRDCEEILLGSLRRSFDSDADGLPDGLELSLGTNANSATPTQDRQSDSDADGGTNANEVLWHTNPDAVDIETRAQVAYQYRQSERAVTAGQACYDLEVSNVSLASTRVGEAGGANRVLLFAAQTPYDDPLAEPVYRMACAEASYDAALDFKDPPTGRIEIPERRPSDTYRAAPVLRPNRQVCQVSNDEDCGLDTVWCQTDGKGTCRCRRPDGTDFGPCPACGDGQDNDGDGLTDFPHDPDCFNSFDDDEGPGAACGNGLDDDGDGRVDFPDEPGCVDFFDDSEDDPSPLPACANGVDDDSDARTDYPRDPTCYAASDQVEGVTIDTAFACDDGLDNDGDGLVDLEDPGCFDVDDITEDGPEVCFYCEETANANPGQCDIGAGYCRPRTGLPPAGACNDSEDCRGAPCIDGLCVRCIQDSDCDSTPDAGDGLCEPSRGWCLKPVYVPAACLEDSECPGTCDADLGFCAVDPFWACRSDDDCGADERCSPDRGFCLSRVFRMGRCTSSGDCETGGCIGGWCMPLDDAGRCRHSDECPLGECVNGTCDQPSFVSPEAFDEQIDCWR